MHALGRGWDPPRRPLLASTGRGRRPISVYNEGAASLEVTLVPDFVGPGIHPRACPVESRGGGNLGLCRGR
jgi:hypothetical protein